MIAETIKKLIGMGYEINILPFNTPYGDFTITIQRNGLRAEWACSLTKIEYAKLPFDEYVGEYIERIVEDIERMKNG